MMTRTTLLAALCCVATPCLAGTKIRVGENVAASGCVSMDRIDHGRWDALLRKHVDKHGNVNYRAWKASPGDRRSLGDYLRHLSHASTTKAASRESKLAFWINAYNAVTIEGILREYPTSSIRNHTARLFGYNIWHDLLLQVGGKPYSLDQMEHQVLRKLGEPRIHFAIVCASKSCPKLIDQAYTPARLEQQLHEGTVDFFATPGNFRDDGRGRFYLSSILKWFADDFGDDQASRLRWMAPYLPADARRAARGGNVSVSYLDYDWNLNDQATAR